MKKIPTVLVLLFVLVGCENDSKPPFHDGTYRGAFFDRGEMEVNVELRLESNRVKRATFRYLKYKGECYLTSENERAVLVRGQFQELLDWLTGKEVGSLDQLYEPENIISAGVDGLTAATIRSGKVISAVRDALNRGVYSR